MRVIKLVLHLFTRFALNDIKHIEYTPVDDVQLILGQNGSGKSSLLEYLLPVCGNVKQDFEEGGYRELTLYKDDTTYIIRNNKTGKHSFKIDGIEENTGGTLAVQNKLILYHFGITPHNQKILLGHKLFTRMSPSERKKWITDISTIDYVYPVTVYNDLRSRHRDIVGGIKLLQANITAGTKAAISDEVISKLASDKKHLQALVDHMLTLIVPVRTGRGIEECVRALDKLVSGYSSTDTIDVNSGAAELSALRSKRALYTDELSRQYKAMDKLEATAAPTDIADVKAKISGIKTKINQLLDNNPIVGITEYETTLNYLQSSYGDITSLLAPISELKGLDISFPHLESVASSAHARREYINGCDSKIYKLTTQLKHIKEHHTGDTSIRCPNCKHIWSPTVSDTDYNGIRKDLDTITRLRDTTAKELKLLESEEENIERVRGIITRFVGYLNLTTDTKNVLKHMMTSDGYKKRGYEALPIIYENTYQTLMLLLPVIDYHKELRALEEELATLESTARASTENLEAAKANVHNEISRLQTAVAKINADIPAIEQQLRNASKADGAITTMKDRIHDIYTARDNELVKLRNEHIKEGIRKLRLLLADVDDRLIAHNDQMAMLGRYQAELSSLNTKEKVLKLAIAGLSPSEGLIAKSISSFLNKFLSDINYLISEVWEYPMELLACDLADNDLDYKFRVLVNNTDIINDISSTSAGMQEMINLAFQVVYSRYKGFENYPLILDEFGRTFDTNHRVRAYNVLEHVISPEFGQIFMVSHFESMYGRFTSADVTVLGSIGVDTNTMSKHNNAILIT